jgi:hypothetical protein
LYDRAVINAGAAASAKIRINAARTLAYLNLKFARVALNGFKIRIGD